MSSQTIELDTPPGPIRPDDLLPSVIEGLGIKPVGEPFKWFGNWTFEFDVPRDEWVEKYQPIIKERVKELYEKGVIRYGSW